METGSQTLESVCVAALMQASEQPIPAQFWGRSSLQPNSLPVRPLLRKMHSVPRLAPIRSLPILKLKQDSRNPSEKELRSGPSSTSRLFPLIKLDTRDRKSENIRTTLEVLKTSRGRKSHFLSVLRSKPVPLRTDLQVLKYHNSLIRQYYAPLASKLLPFRPPLMDRAQR
jgi:hypothetical protein